MRLPVVLATLWSATALAQTAPPPAPPAPAPALTKVNVEELPESCRDLGKLAESASKGQALSARISLASCVIDQKTKPIVLCDCEQSVIDINEAIDPSLALLDEVVRFGDAATQILARHTQGEILSGFAQRMLTTVPPAANSSEEATALRNTRLDMLQPLLQPWQTRAQAAFADVDKLARANPQLAKNPAVLAAVRATRAKLQQGAQSAKR